MMLAGLTGGCRPSDAPPGALADSAADSASHSSRTDRRPPASTEVERAVRQLPLSGPLAKANAEVSGLAWHGDDLVLLPQHPFRMSGRADEGLLFAISKAEIDAVLSGRRDGPLRPRPIALLAPELEARSPVYQGCEALAFADGNAYLVTEAVADAETGAMRGYLFAGRLRGDTLRLDTRRRAELPPQTTAGNMAYEALLAAPDRLVALYEANGRNVNTRPRAFVFSPALQPLRSLRFPPVEYRLTDATALDADNRFWVMNYFFPGEKNKLVPAFDSLAREQSTREQSTSPQRPPSARRDATPGLVERLVEYRLGADGLRRTSAPPLRLSLQPGVPRNWEGLVRLHSEAYGPGFLLITDQYPETMLGFVAAGREG
jgi:hypothetical protein